MPKLRIAERHSLDDPAGLPRIVVRDRGFQVLALWRLHTELAAKPAEERNGRS
jgi:hypothetical protein